MAAASEAFAATILMSTRIESDKILRLDSVTLVTFSIVTASTDTCAAAATASVKFVVLKLNCCIVIERCTANLTTKCISEDVGVVLVMLVGAGVVVVGAGVVVVIE
jgi:hypothetical protein